MTGQPESPAPTTALTPRLLRRGLEIFAVISIAAGAGVLLYGNNFHAFITALLGLHWWWLVVGLGLASMDWFGGGTRLWVVARHVHPGVRWRDMVISGGMSAWAAYLTPFQTGAGPMMMWTMRRAGVRLPEAMTSTFMTFVATVIFFAIAGPLSIILGAGRSLARHGVVLGITLYDLFKTSFLIFILIGILMAFAMFFPRLLRDFVHWLATRLEKRSTRVASRIDGLRDGIDRAHQCLVAFGSPKGLLALFWAIILSAPSHANKLLAGYIAMRALGLPAQFFDILLVQTFISFLLYFAPTPGASGLAEVLSVAVMSIYVPRPLLPSYTLLWRFINSYATVAFGSLLFWRWLRGGLVDRELTVVSESGTSP
ncbi:MAG TPA: lysylphosphatidylglycerol synthase transmembrane domain-containing protein [Gemmatimonadales bacterium]|nr:lysylphosphatidylglycerol synthase transmembrane domain-containing protein [Gemmatimonadales bacterium]